MDFCIENQDPEKVTVRIILEPMLKNRSDSDWSVHDDAFSHT